MKTILLRSDPIAMRLMIGSSRSAAMPWTYCGVTAVSSMTTPAAFAVARPAAAPMSSTEAAANRASAATSSRSPNRPALIASLSWLGDYPSSAADEGLDPPTCEVHEEARCNDPQQRTDLARLTGG